MPYLAMTARGKEYKFNKMPRRDMLFKTWLPNESILIKGSVEMLTPGTIKLLTGKDMNWEDGPIELTE